MIKQYLENLNNEQKKAVLETDGPVLVLAGAGSGKTRVLTNRVAYLITEKNINPQNILVVTFTNKAADNMKERIKKMIGNRLMPFAGTFHSFCVKVLREDGKHLGIPGSFVIYDDKDKEDAIKQIMNNLDISSKNFHPRAIAATISEAKNELVSASEYPKIARGFFQETSAKVYFYYQKLLKKNWALDFDDLLLETNNLLQSVSEVRGKYQDRYRYILIDEYQDTNRAQYEISKILAKRYKNICIVGDASQSIYSWRGADYRNIMNFQKDFPQTKIFHLEQNYRSTQKILEAATSVIQHNTSHPILQLWTNNSKGDNLILYEARNEQDEAVFITNSIKEFLNQNLSDLTLKDIAVLYRTNAQSRVIEEAFLHVSIPYSLIGGTRFYDRKEIKDVLAYLKLLSNKKDTVSYQRVEKIGKKRMQKFLNFAAKLKDNDLKNTATLELMDQIILETDYLSLYDKKSEEDKSKLENIKELRSVATQFSILSEFLENVALVQKEYLPQDQSYYPRKNKKQSVSLMTIHAAKGLEFRIVFLVGMEEGLFPHSQSLLDQSELEEERRLCYVALTRAKSHLFLTCTRRRLFFGKSTNNIPSRFIADIPEHLLTLRTEYDPFS